MRHLVLVPLAALAACSGGSEPQKQESEAAPVEQMSAGQWEMTTEVTKLTQRDQGAPALKMPQGSKTSRSVCIGEGEVKQPPAGLFVPEELECTYRDSYISGGRVNATLACSREGLRGNIGTIVNGSFTADTIEATATTETSLSGDGDVRIDAKLTGRRTGDCTPEPAKK